MLTMLFRRAGSLQGSPPRHDSLGGPNSHHQQQLDLHQQHHLQQQQQQQQQEQFTSPRDRHLLLGTNLSLPYSAHREFGSAARNLSTERHFGGSPRAQHSQQQEHFMSPHDYAGMRDYNGVSSMGLATGSVLDGVGKQDEVRSTAVGGTMCLCT